MTNEEVHKELFDRVNALERGQSETNYIYLFGRSCTESSTPDAMNGRIYSASIIENNEYIINLIPCVKNGVPAMYDTTDGQFHYRFGIGEFVAGPRVSDEL